LRAALVGGLHVREERAPVLASTFVYVSNAEDGDIGMYTLQADGSLQPGQRFKATKLVMPMAVSPDKRFLYARIIAQHILRRVLDLDLVELARLDQFVINVEVRVPPRSDVFAVAPDRSDCLSGGCAGGGATSSRAYG
jgi:hypothetical protein